MRERDFVEFLIFRNRFLVLWELLGNSPDSYKDFKLVKNEQDDGYSLVNGQEEVIPDDIIFDELVEIKLNDLGMGYYLHFNSSFHIDFTDDEIETIITEGLIFKFKE